MALGIDFGTSNSSAAYLRGDRIVYVKEPLRHHGFSFPSSVFLADSGDLLIGYAAENRARSDPTRYVREFKRELGRDAPFRLGDREFRPEELVGAVLTRLAAEAQKAAAEEMNGRVVLTIPATYQAHKRRVMEAAGRAAGFTTVELLEEPVAAALAYAHEGGSINEGDILLIYDLGGGTFDAALLRRTGDGFESLAPAAGLDHIGGIDFDRAIRRELVARAPDSLRAAIDPTRTDRAAHIIGSLITEASRNLKHHLSVEEVAEEFPPIGLEPVQLRLTRREFERMIAPLLEEANALCRRLIADAGLKPEQVSGALLVGGSCRIPAVAEAVKRELGLRVLHVADPELAVCAGAALRAAESEKQEEERTRALRIELSALLTGGRQLDAVERYHAVKGGDVPEVVAALRALITAPADTQAAESAAAAAQPEREEVEAVREQIAKLLLTGERIAAIVLYRDHHGGGLQAAQDAINEEVTYLEQIDTLLQEKQNRAAIRLYQSRYEPNEKRARAAIRRWPGLTRLRGETATPEQKKPEREAAKTRTPPPTVAAPKIVSMQTLTGHGQPVASLAFAPDSTRLASGSLGKRVRIWELETGRQVSEVWHPHNGVHALAWLPPAGGGSEKEGVVSGGVNGQLHLLNPVTGAVRRTYVKGEAEAEMVRCVDASADGKRIVVQTLLEMRVRATDTGEGEWVVATSQLVSGGSGAFGRAAFRPGGEQVTAVFVDIPDGSDGASLGLYFLDLDLGPGTYRVRAAAKSPAFANKPDEAQPAFTFSVDTRLYAHTVNDGTILIYDTHTAVVLHEILLPGSWYVKGMAFASGNEHLVIAGLDGTIRIRELASGVDVAQLIAPTGSSPLHKVAISPDRQWIAAGGDLRTIWLWRIDGL